MRSDHFRIGTLRRVLRSVGHSLVDLHTRGIVHGDIKVSNVLLEAVMRPGAFPSPMLADFGLSGTLDMPVHVGTTSYMGAETVAFVREASRSPSITPHSAQGILILVV